MGVGGVVEPKCTYGNGFYHDVWRIQEHFKTYDIGANRNTQFLWHGHSDTPPLVEHV